MQQPSKGESKCFVVGHRLDAATFAYKVAFPRALLDELVTRSLVAKKHGRAAFKFGDVSGELRYSRVERAWLVQAPRFYARFVLHAPGAEGDEPGWTLEIKWLASALAVMSPRRVRLASHRIARSCGRVYGARLRRIDLCADIANWAVDHADVERFVRRPQAGLDSNAFSDDAIVRLQDAGEFDESVPTERIVTHYKTSVTGFTFCPGSPMMARVYDKRAELKLKRAEIREVEESTWRANGWDGDAPVTRVEFQIRGEALRDFGLRDPDAPTQDARTNGGRLTAMARFAGFETVLDRVWRAGLAWLRFTRRGSEDQRASRRPTDERWEMMAKLAFNAQGADGVHRRVRRRGGASVEQTLGCALSTVAQAGQLQEWSRELAREFGPTEATLSILHAVFRKAADLTASVFFRKWGSDEAFEHVVEVSNATRAREFDDGAIDWFSDFGAPLAAAS
jgi:hypothetical protein